MLNNNVKYLEAGEYTYFLWFCEVMSINTDTL